MVPDAALLAATETFLAGGTTAAVLAAAAPLIAEAERKRCTELARKVSATYPVTVGPAPGQLAGRETSFPFGDYLEDIP